MKLIKPLNSISYFKNYNKENNDEILSLTNLKG